MVISVAFEPISVDFDLCILGSNLGNHIIFFYGFFFFFFVICYSALFFFLSFVTVQIQHYCIYSDSSSLLSLVMPRPPAPTAL